MDDRSQSYVASMLTVVAGAWLLLSPFWISVTGGALISVLVVGGILAIAGLVQMFWENALPSWVNMAAAVGLFITAFLFEMSEASMWNMAITAIVAFVIAAWDGVEVTHMHRGQHIQT